tara:strand:+ start:1028 stop:1711 length:684 start_codon:yes stop_codon:yes gene_type:complete
MQISNETFDILKNFAMINPSIVLSPGNVLQTVAPSKNIMAKAIIKDAFPLAGAIYDLHRFLGVVSLFEDPAFDFSARDVTIRGKQNSVNYTFAEPSMIITPPDDKQITVNNPDVEIDVDWSKLSNVLKAANVLQVPEISLTSTKDGVVSLKAIDSKNPSADEYKEELGTYNEIEYNFIFKTETFKMMSADYNVKINKQGISQFTSKSEDSPKLTYWIAVEQHSTYGG